MNPRAEYVYVWRTSTHVFRIHTYTHRAIGPPCAAGTADSMTRKFINSTHHPQERSAAARRSCCSLRIHVLACARALFSLLCQRCCLSVCTPFGCPWGL